MNNNTKYPILYSFRRCPYAIRTRMVIKSAKIVVELREIKLKNKPKDFLEISPKGTVPVLITNSGQVLEESLDIIYWALRLNDPNNLLSEYNLSKNEFDELLKKLENEFKPNLDKYKYPNRYLGIDKNSYRDKNLNYLFQLDNLLKASKYLNSNHVSLIDYLIFPFIRQFRNVNENWFDCLSFHFLKKWLYDLMQSEDFESIMKKYNIWNSNDIPFYTNFSDIELT